MKKYLIAAFLSLVLAMLSVGCSNTAGVHPDLSPNSPITLELWHYYNGPQKTAFDDMILEFNETVGLEQGIIIEPYAQGHVNALSDKVLSSARQEIGADPLPALFATYADTAFEVNQLGMLANLDDYFTAQELAAYHPEFIAEGRFSSDGSLKIFPIAKSIELMMVNLTDWEDFAAATGADLDQLSTFEGVTKTAQAYYRWSGGKAFFGRDAMANYMIIGARQLDLELFAPEEDGSVSVQLEDEVLQQLWDNYYIPLVSGWFSSNGRFRSTEATLGGIIAMVGSSSATAYFPTEVTVSDSQRYAIRCAILPAPRFAQGEPYAIQQGAGMAVSTGSPAQEYAAALFLKWITQPERNTRLATASHGYLPVTTAALDLTLIDQSLKANYPEEEAYQRMYQTYSAALDSITNQTLYTTPPFQHNLEAREVLESSLNDRALADRQVILTLISQGLSQKAALARLDTDAQFSAWSAQLKADLENALNP